MFGTFCKKIQQGVCSVVHIYQYFILDNKLGSTVSQRLRAQLIDNSKEVYLFLHFSVVGVPLAMNKASIQYLFLLFMLWFNSLNFDSPYRYMLFCYLLLAHSVIAELYLMAQSFLWLMH